jgi:hypothetical protein
MYRTRSAMIVPLHLFRISEAEPMKHNYPGDPRSYDRFKPPGSQRYFVKCLAEETHADDTILHCNFVQREDYFKGALKQSNMHACHFVPVGAKNSSQQRLEDMVLRQRAERAERSPIFKEIAIFLARSNVSVNAACSGGLRSLLVKAFEDGWEAREKSGLPKAQATRAAIPSFCPATISDSFSAVSAETNQALIRIFRQYKYVGLSIDGITIKNRKFLNLDIVHPISGPTTFTYDFLDENTFTTATFVAKSQALLMRMLNDGLMVGGVTSDGCAFQKKGLLWRCPDSLQAQDDRFSKTLFVPCICHKLQNAMVVLFKTNVKYHALISQARSAAVILRKPANRALLPLSAFFVTISLLPRSWQLRKG